MHPQEYVFGRDAVLLEVNGPCSDDVVKTEDDCGLVLPGKPGVRALAKASIYTTWIPPTMLSLFTIGQIIVCSVELLLRILQCMRRPQWRCWWPACSVSAHEVGNCHAECRKSLYPAAPHPHFALKMMGTFHHAVRSHHHAMPFPPAAEADDGGAPDADCRAGRPRGPFPV